MFNLQQLRIIRQAEIDFVRPYLKDRSKLLEVGAGTGEQARMLADLGFDVSAVDVNVSNYSHARVFPVIDYDGCKLPFDDDSFGIVYSSNVLEHVAHLSALQAEIRRVLRPGGYCVHVLPSTNWRFWTVVSAFPNAVQAGYNFAATLAGGRRSEKSYLRRVAASAYSFAGRSFEALAQPRHGERGNTITEHWYFSTRWWCRAFERDGFDVVECRPMGLFYTGYMVLGRSLPLDARRKLATRLGSACNLFVVRPSASAPDAQNVKQKNSA